MRRSFQQLLKPFHREIGIPQNTLQHLGVEGAPSMIRDRHPLPFLVFLDTMAPTLPGKEETRSLQGPDHFVSGYPGQPSHGSNCYF